MANFFRLFFYLLDNKAKKAIPFLMIAFAFSSLLDVIGIGLIGLFLGLLMNPHYFVQKLQPFIFLQPNITESHSIILAAVMIVSAFLLKAVIAILIQTKVIFFAHSFSVRLKTRLMMAYQYAPYSYHIKKNSTVLLARIQTSINHYIDNLLLPTFVLISNTFVTLAILLLLFILHPFSTGFLMLMFVLLIGGYDWLVKRKLLAMGKEVALASGEIGKSGQQAIDGLSEIRVLGKENYFIQSLNKQAYRLAHAYGIIVIFQQIPRYLIENTVAFFIVGLSLWGLAAGANMGSIIAMAGMFTAAGARLLPTVSQMMTALNQLRGAKHQMQLIYDDLVELDQLNAGSSHQLSSSSEEKLIFSTLQLREVYFHYPQTSVSAIEGINMTIRKGQSIGLIGPSGAGKSTLVNIILGFLAPQRGQLLVDEKPIQNVRAWLNNFAYIPQTIFLIDDTLRRNIALGVEDKEINADRMQQVIQFAQLSDVVQQLPRKLDTMIGENGVRLSGGQRQRVALARALYHERDIIVMDEATSALDNETESEVINTIKRLKGNKTLIVIAHRLTTVEHCDVLFRLEKGRITASGSFEEVMKY